MITSVKVNNFKILSDVSLNFLYMSDLKEFVQDKRKWLPHYFYLMGANSTGKTTILDAIRMVKKAWVKGEVEYTPHFTRVGENTEINLSFTDDNIEPKNLYVVHLIITPDKEYEIAYYSLPVNNGGEDESHDKDECWAFGTDESERYNEEYKGCHDFISLVLENLNKSYEMTVEECLSHIRTHEPFVESLNHFLNCISEYSLDYHPSDNTFYKKFNDVKYAVTLTSVEQSLVKVFYDAIMNNSILYDDCGAHGAILRKLPEISSHRNKGMIIVSANRDAIPYDVAEECLLFTSINKDVLEIHSAADYINTGRTVHSTFMSGRYHSEPFIYSFS